jgi:hypothetical protein
MARLAPPIGSPALSAVYLNEASLIPIRRPAMPSSFTTPPARRERRRLVPDGQLQQSEEIPHPDGTTIPANGYVVF